MNDPSQMALLVVEDSEADYAAFLRVYKHLDQQPTLFRCRDGEDTLEFLHHLGKYQGNAEIPRPNLILLDLNLPGTDGREVLGQIKQDYYLKAIPVVILTTSNNSLDIKECYTKGANSYLIKALPFSKFAHALEVLLEYWLKVIVLPDTKLQEGKEKETGV
ncbi:MAG: response regulator [Chloroflexi bacterium]|nr:response regulator [Chloroflexota bacterium]